MSISAINGFNSFQYGVQSSEPIKPETRKKLEELGIDDKNLRTETQAQNKISEKEEEIKKQIQERLQAEASQLAQNTQTAQQAQQPQGIQNVDKVDGVNQAQQVKQPEGIEQQHSLQNNQTGNEQLKAFAGSQATQQPAQAQPFEASNEIIAMYNKLKLGLL